MKLLPTLACGPAIWLLSTVSAAALSADSLWKDWTARLAAQDISVTVGDTNRSGDQLVLTDIALEVEGNRLTLKSLKLREQSDGSVTLEPSAQLKLEPTADIDLRFAIEQSGFIATVREDLGKGFSYDFKANKIDIDSSFSETPELSELPEGTQAALPSTTALQAQIQNPSGSYSHQDGSITQYLLTLASDAANYEFSINDPNYGLASNSAASSSSLHFEGELALPELVKFTDFDQPGALSSAFKAGLAMRLKLNQGDSTTLTSEENEFLPYGLTTKSGPSEVELSVDRTAFSLNAQATPGSVEMSSAIFPAPLALSFGDSSIVVRMPSMTEAEAQPYELAIALADLTPDEAAWALLDPKQALPHTPFALDLSLSGNIANGWIDLGETAVNNEEVLPLFETLSFGQSFVKGVGAEAHLSGALDIDNSHGMPMPIGDLSLRLLGVMRLIDGLEANELVPAAELALTRAMIEQYFKKGSQEDEYLGDLSLSEGFGVALNGQPLQ